MLSVPFVGKGRNYADSRPVELEGLDLAMIDQLRRELTPAEWFLLATPTDELIETAHGYGVSARAVLHRRAVLQDRLRDKYHT